MSFRSLSMRRLGLLRGHRQPDGAAGGLHHREERAPGWNQGRAQVRGFRGSRGETDAQINRGRTHVGIPRSACSDLGLNPMGALSVALARTRPSVQSSGCRPSTRLASGRLSARLGPVSDFSQPHRLERESKHQSCGCPLKGREMHWKLETATCSPSPLDQSWLEPLPRICPNSEKCFTLSTAWSCSGSESIPSPKSCILLAVESPRH